MGLSVVRFYLRMGWLLSGFYIFFWKEDIYGEGGRVFVDGLEFFG